MCLGNYIDFLHQKKMLIQEPINRIVDIDSRRPLPDQQETANTYSPRWQSSYRIQMRCKYLYAVYYTYYIVRLLICVLIKSLIIQLKVKNPQFSLG